MFVRIIHCEKVKEGAANKTGMASIPMTSGISHRQIGESVYECRQVSLYPQDENRVIISMEGNVPDKTVHVDVNKEETEVYLMNNEGRTIDSYRWLDDK